jgi:hypothetical protein
LPPVDALDDCFKRHDENYRNAKSQMDLLQADIQLMNELLNLDLSQLSAK